MDMEIALRPRLNAPDVVKSAIGSREKISENTIDKLLSKPDKIIIPERYIPDDEEETLSPDEKRRRHEKVEAIKKMLSETPSISANVRVLITCCFFNLLFKYLSKDASTIPHSHMTEEKRQREHLLHLNQILAMQVKQMSKIVAGKYL